MSDKQPVLRFIAMSDVHVKDDPSCVELARLRKGLAEGYAYARSQPYDRIDQIVIIGDFANNGTEQQMINFKEALYPNLGEETGVIISTASHEYGAGEDVAKERLKRIYGLDPFIHRVVNGFHFISVSSTRGCRFDDAEKAFAAASLKQAFDDDPRKPVFFFQHPHVSGTVACGIAWGEDDLIPILVNYPQIINFSGHSHAPVNDPRSIHQKHFTSLGTGTLSYFECEDFDMYYGTVPPTGKEAAQYLVVEAYADNSVVVKPYDIITGQFFPYVWHIDTPSDPDTFIYTDKRYETSVRPYFTDKTAKVDLSGDKLKVTYPQASIDEDRVDYYMITIRRADGVICRRACMYSDYFMYYMPETLTFELEPLPAGEYKAQIKAFSFWGKESADSIDFEFKV